MKLELDPIQILGLLIAFILVAYNMIKGIFGGKNEKLDEFLKSLDVEEEEEVIEKVKPLPKKKTQPHTPSISKKPPPHHSSIPKQPPKIVEYKVDATYAVRGVRRPSHAEKLVRQGNLRDLIVTQVILNKPPGAWW